MLIFDVLTSQQTLRANLVNHPLEDEVIMCPVYKRRVIVVFCFLFPVCLSLLVNSLVVFMQFAIFLWATLADLRLIQISNGLHPNKYLIFTVLVIL